LPHYTRKAVQIDDLLIYVDRVQDSLAACLTLSQTIIHQTTEGGVIADHRSMTITERFSSPSCLRWQGDDLEITATPGGCTVRRPPPMIDLPKADREHPTVGMAITRPFGLKGAGTIYQ